MTESNNLIKRYTGREFIEFDTRAPHVEDAGPIQVNIRTLATRAGLKVHIALRAVGELPFSLPHNVRAVVSKSRHKVVNGAAECDFLLPFAEKGRHILTLHPTDDSLLQAN